MKLIVIFFVFGCTIFIDHVRCEINPKWEHPHAWGKIQKEQDLADDSLAQSSGDTEIGINKNYCGNRVKYDVLEIYYLKLVNYLVGKDRLKLDSNSGNFKRHITIELSNEDIEQFANIKNNVHAIDAKIFEILAKNNNGIIANSIDDLLSVYEKLELFMSDKIPFEDLKFFMLIIAFLLFVWKLSRVMKRNVIITFIGVIFLMSYTFDYMRCCQEKEIEKLLELQNKNENPCEIQKPKSVFEFIAQRLGKTPEDLCKQHLMGRKKYFDKEYCDVWDHFVDYLVYKNVLTFVQKMQHFVKTIIADSAFPYNIICVAIFLFLLKDLLIAITSSFISNIWASIISGNRARHEPIQNKAQIANKPSGPIHITVNLKSKKKSKPKVPKCVAMKAIVNDRIEELVTDEITSSSDECDASVSTKAESIKEEIKVIT